jgi:hypothetical protein
MTRTTYTFSKSRNSFRTALLFTFFFFAAVPTVSYRTERKAGGGVPGTGTAAVGSRPVLARSPSLKFVENDGQTADSVRFVSHGSGYELLLMQQDAVLALSPARRLDLSPTRRSAFFRERHASRRKSNPSYLRVHLVNSNPGSKIAGMDSAPGRVDYFLGGDPAKWRTNVPAFARVKYANVYPGIDLVFYGNQRQIEYDFIVAPGADPKAIDLNLEGARNLRVNARGDLLVHMSDGDVEFRKPFAYQESRGERHEVSSSFALSADHRVSFEVASYDSSKPLIIDPVLAYSTYLGGESDDSGQAIAVDAAGNFVVVGSTLSLQFPTTSGAFSQSPLATNANGLVFVTKFDPTGTEALYSSYVGGTGGDFGFAVALDATGKIHVTGETDSTDFPTTPNALKPGPNSGNTNGTSFVFKIDPTLAGPASLLYSSYLGGTQSSTITEFGNGIATDSNGMVYIVGLTASQPGALLANFPVTATTAFQAAPGAGLANGTSFLTKLDTTQSGAASLIYSTYLGGNGANASGPGFGDSAFAVAEDSTGKTYLTGATTSTDFPTALGAFQQSAPAAIAQGTIFISKFDTTLAGAASLLYSSYLGGEAADFGDAIALGPSNVAYLTGSTSSLSFPTTPGAFQTTGNAASIAFISLIDTTASGSASLKYSSFLGGSQTSTATGIAADSTGNAYVVGSAQGADFPTTPFAFQISPESGASGAGFVTKLSPAGQGAADLIYSTYFGGSGANGNSDEINGVALNSANHAVVAGDTASATGFPVTPNAFQSTLNGSSDAFVAELTFEASLTVSPSSLTFGSSLVGKPSAPQTVTLTSNSILPIAFSGAVISNGAPAAANSDFVASTTCGQSIAANSSCTITVVFTPSVNGPETADLVITDGASAIPQTIPLSANGANTANFALSASPTSLTVAQGATGTLKLTVTPAGGFNQAVALSCSGAPSMSTCAVSPASITPTDGVTPVVATVTITTQSASLVRSPASELKLPPPSWQAIFAALAIVFLSLMSRRSRLSAQFALLALSLSALLALGCGGSHSAPPPPPSGGTPKGTSTLTLTGTSGTMNNSTSVTLTVN